MTKSKNEPEWQPTCENIPSHPKTPCMLQKFYFSADILLGLWSNPYNLMSSPCTSVRLRSSVYPDRDKSRDHTIGPTWKMVGFFPLQGKWSHHLTVCQATGGVSHIHGRVRIRIDSVHWHYPHPRVKESSSYTEEGEKAALSDTCPGCLTTEDPFMLLHHTNSHAFHRFFHLGLSY